MERQFEQPRTSPEYKRILNLARETPVVESGLYSPEQAAYFMSWRALIEERRHQPDSVRSILEGGIGPDLSSALLLANPTRIVGVENQFSIIPGKFRSENIKGLLDHWKDNSADQSILAMKRRAGFYNIDLIEGHGFVHLILLELRCLGVDLQQVNIEQRGEYNVTLTFPWCYPGQSEPRQREVAFILGNIKSSIQLINELGNERFDCYFEKAMYMGSLDNGQLPLISEHYMNNGAFMMIGTTPSIKDPQRRDKLRRKNFQAFRSPVQNLYSILGPDWQPVPGPISATKAMVDFQRRMDPTYIDTYNYGEYGWYLVGAQKDAT